MQRKYAILIDAAFLKKKLGSQQTPTDVRQVVGFTEKLKNRPELARMALHRIYYYDAEPLSATKLKPFTGGRENGEDFNFSSTPLYKPNMQLLNELKRKSYFAVRLGEVHFRGWLVAPKKLDPESDKKQITVTADDLIPSVRQKGVDMRIGLDISSLALKNQVDVIVLVAGDSDFIPALKFARREGKQIFLYTLGQKVLAEMYAHTDVCMEERRSLIYDDPG